MRHLAPLVIALAASATAVHGADLRFRPCPAKTRFTVIEDPPRPEACVMDSAGVVRAVLYSRPANEVAVFADSRRYVLDDPPTTTLRLSGARAPSPSVLFDQVPADLAERIAVAAGLSRDVVPSTPFLHAPPASRPPERLAPRTPQVLVRYQYDWRGRVCMKIGEEGVRQYVYDGDSERVLNELDGQGNVVASYQWAGDRLVSITRPGQGTRYPMYDGLGSIVGLTDEHGAVTARYHYDAGGSLRDAAELAADPNRYAFTGHRFEPETGFYRAGARHLAHDVGRFVTQDSYLGKPEEPFSLHRYLYANANPLRYVDPTGHQSKDLAQEYRLYREEQEREAFRSWCGTNPRACAAKVAADAARARENDARVTGTLRAVGGVGQALAGGAALGVPEPTAVTKVAGTLALTRGIDNLQAGLRQALSGQVVETASGAAIRTGLEASGVSPDAAAQLQAAAEIGLDVGSGAAAARAARLGGPAVAAGPLPVPVLAGTKSSELLRDAMGRLRAAVGTPGDKADLFEAMAVQIEERTAGAWHATRIAGGDGSHVFVGRLGETLVVNPEGTLFRGKVTAIQPRPDGLVMPDYNALRKVE